VWVAVRRQTLSSRQFMLADVTVPWIAAVIASTVASGC
jgi:hypothetical protein